MRVGIGYDVHKLETGYDLILGGVKIPNEKGIVAHSDGDCLIHSIMDALLGAASLYDIGTYFPDNNEEFKNISSLKLLKNVLKLITDEGYKIVNIDSVIICERPKIKPYINEMKENIGNVLNLTSKEIGIKATTEEKLGFTGREEGIACEAICLLTKI